MCIHCNARDRHASHDGHDLRREDRSTRAQTELLEEELLLLGKKKLKGSPVVVSVATAKVKGRRQS